MTVAIVESSFRLAAVVAGLLCLSCSCSCSWGGRPEPEEGGVSAPEFKKGSTMDVGDESGRPTVFEDVSYGPDDAQRLDVYTPPAPRAAPIFFMVHGGAWQLGDKAASAVVENKRRHWVEKGYVMVSVNYRMHDPIDPIEQAGDVALALAFVQKNASKWGADAERVLLVGHSSGAHLVSLLASDRAIRTDKGARPWRGTVALDSAAYDVEKIMRRRHYRFYDRVFGSDPEYWKKASPFHRLTGLEAPFLAVCSSDRADSCPQARAFVEKARNLGGTAVVLEIPRSHKEINEELGQAGDYTSQVDGFLRSVELP